MWEKVTSSFLTLPVELVYRVLDYVDDATLFCSALNVCTRLNAIIDTYHRYQVNSSFSTTTFLVIKFVSYRLSLHLY